MAYSSEFLIHNACTSSILSPQSEQNVWYSGSGGGASAPAPTPCLRLWHSIGGRKTYKMWCVRFNFVFLSGSLYHSLWVCFNVAKGSKCTQIVCATGGVYSTVQTPFRMVVWGGKPLRLEEGWNAFQNQLHGSISVASLLTGVYHCWHARMMNKTVHDID